MGALAARTRLALDHAMMAACSGPTPVFWLGMMSRWSSR
jgi:hypothetical protein